MRDHERVVLSPSEGAKVVRIYLDGVPISSVDVALNPASLLEAEFAPA